MKQKEQLIQYLESKFSTLDPAEERTAIEALKWFTTKEKTILQGEITNKELQELLKQYPDDAIVVIEYCNIRELQYHEDSNLITID